MLNIVGILVAMFLMLSLVYLIRAVRVHEEQAQQPAKPHPLVQQTLALMEVTRSLLSTRR